MWNIISTALGLTGIVLAILFYFKGKQVRKIAYSKKSFSLLGESATSLSGFSASYQGQELSALKASKIMIWNDGNTTISSTDIASSESLSIRFPKDDKILETKILSVSSSSNDVFINLDNGKLIAEINFDYLDPGQGFIVSTLHAGDERSIEIAGVLKGGSIGIYKPSQWPRLIGYAALFLAMGLMIVRMFDFIDFDSSYYYMFAVILTQIVGMVFITGGSIFLKRSAQKSLDTVFEEEFTPEEFKG